tara:strand:- start:4211 stop:4720 length:510 start_codon:yes stop_codon:yes gene_type:complete
MDKLAKEQKLTAYMQINSIWEKIHKTPVWVILLLLLLTLNLLYHWYSLSYYEDKAERDLVLKWAYKAASFSHLGETDNMNKYLNKVVGHQLYRSSQSFRNRIRGRCEVLGTTVLVDGLLHRDILIDNPEAHETLDRWVEFQTTTKPEEVQKNINCQYGEHENKHATIRR